MSKVNHIHENEPTQNITIFFSVPLWNKNNVFFYNFSHIPLDAKLTFLELYAVVHYKASRAMW